MEAQTQLQGAGSKTTKRPQQIEIGISRPIVMGVDPFDRKPERQRELLKAIRLWTSKLPSRVLPVGVVTLQDVAYPVEVVIPIQDRLVNIIDQSIAPVLKKLSPENSLPPKVLLQSLASRRSLVGTLIDLAKQEGAPIIATNTHGRSGFKWFRLGSFTEDLISMSSIPVLTVNPKTRVQSSVKEVIFPTDLTPDNKPALEQVIKWAKSLSARLVIYHSFQVPLFFGGSPEFVSPIDPLAVEKAWRQLEEHKRKQGTDWCEDAKSQGVECIFEFSSSDDNVSIGVNRLLEERESQFVFVQNSRPVLSAPSSLVRDLVLQSKSPVLVFRTESK